MGTVEEFDTYGYFAYSFTRQTSEPLDSSIHGAGSPVNKCGLIKGGFRPSDDASTYPFHVPANAMFASYLLQLADDVGFNGDKALLARARKLSVNVGDAVLEHGVVTDAASGNQYFAYEVDCFGNSYFMDD